MIKIFIYYIVYVNYIVEDDINLLIEYYKWEPFILTEKDRAKIIVMMRLDEVMFRV